MNGVGAAGVDPFETWDGAYVLGALSPQDRSDFEEHLRTCDRCAESVRQLAGMPGLLSQADPDGLVAAGVEPAPPDLLPGLLTRVARERRRRFTATVSAAVLALAACLALVFSAVFAGGADGSGDEGGVPDGGPPVVAGGPMTPLGDWPVRADVSLVEADWGTRVEMECQYGDGEGGAYVLVAVGRDGETEELASWRALPENSASMTVGTPMSRAAIEWLEVRTLTGVPVLRLAVTP
ncbi:anti-sigma factor [Streptomyces sp. 8K308]|uniref:anti-sigma factor family protein n=1 Tax=Streptomyces sp. 8K308 TaxID=2530388 RepID=UPI0010461AB1|nr:zf-HC2 domain-containing protein [Streptomyces sp. 8K308]TDC20674.1 anti-sigma factor [Streptomyces sp. 8K308]